MRLNNEHYLDLRVCTEVSAERGAAGVVAAPALAPCLRLRGVRGVGGGEGGHQPGHGTISVVTTIHHLNGDLNQ